MKTIFNWSSHSTRSLTLRMRLLGGFVAFALVTVLIIVSLRVLIGGTQGVDREWRDAAGAIRYSQELKQAVAKTQILVYDRALTEARGGADRWRLEVARVDKIAERVGESLGSRSNRIDKIFTGVQGDLAKLQTRQARVFVSRAGKATPSSISAMVASADNVGEGLDAIIARKTRRLKVLEGMAGRRSTLLDIATLFGVVVAALAATFLARFANTGVIDRLIDLRDGVKKIAAGTVTVRVDDSGADEIAALSSEFNVMAANLESVASEQRQRYSQLTDLYKISKAISATQDVDKLLTQVLDQSLVLVGAETGSIMLLTPEGDELTIGAAKGLDDETIKNTRVKLGEGVSGAVALTGEPLIIQDGVEDSQVPGTRAANDALSVPLIAGEKVIGVINANNKQSGSFDRNDLHFFTTLAGQIAASVANTNLIGSIQGAYFNTIKVLAAAIDAKDKYTHGHSERVAMYSVAIGRQMGLAKVDLTRIEAAAYLHDIGKIGVPDSVLNKEGKLTTEEMDQIKNHPAMAAEILEHIDFPWGNVIPGVRGHHERFDGKGYPDGLAGYDIEFDARIIAVADTFDAMTSDRPYRRALDQNIAITQLVGGRCGQFDPDVVDAFVPALLTTLMTSMSGGVDDQSDLEFSATKPATNVKESDRKKARAST